MILNAPDYFIDTTGFQALLLSSGRSSKLARFPNLNFYWPLLRKSQNGVYFIVPTTSFVAVGISQRFLGRLFFFFFE